ncbi:MAG: hypothetical protein J5379_04460 [Clostridiales bacterium]|nr:hypothetical protein [Clostridiales bacterium]
MDSDFLWKLAFVKHLMYIRKVNWLFIVAGVIILAIFGSVFLFNFIVAESYLTAEYKVNTEATLVAVYEESETYTERDSNHNKTTRSEAYYELCYEYELNGETKEYSERSSYKFHKEGYKTKLRLFSDDGVTYYRSDFGVLTFILLIVSTAFIAFALWLIIKVIVILVKHIEPPPIPGSEEEQETQNG